MTVRGEGQLKVAKVEMKTHLLEVHHSVPCSVEVRLDQRHCGGLVSMRRGRVRAYHWHTHQAPAVIKHISTTHCMDHACTTSTLHTHTTPHIAHTPTPHTAHTPTHCTPVVRVPLSPPQADLRKHNY